MEIGKIIKENRTAKNMTQEQLAKELFVSRPLISKWENGKSYPDLEQLLILSDFFDLTLDELLKGDKKMTKKLNTIIKRKHLLTGMIITLLIIIFFTLYSMYSIWTRKSIQLKPSDIEITSIKIEKNPSINVINVATEEKVTLPEDVSYQIKYKVKKSFTTIQTGYYFDQDQDNIYVDIRGNRTLFPSNDEHTFMISSDAKLYGENENIKIDENYVQRMIKNKDIKILDVNSLAESISTLGPNSSGGTNIDSNIKSWTLLKQSDLKK
ncbi:helix-turn-helix domain-containing protein [Vagococcus elongatus]|uniref:HTH cro/C1-type domain-containing protein n=1 Tax=Vagococcus elongatus TaxID=180344 RepID=A0A430AME5_9ENTE|nr:helix-turn-helix transcriptional regulator [Vagococcus elongatus]RSU09269.1 hypothetical protein CBF29_11825 [Vagococcus elongatus]